jgi:hypothetical protein
MNKLLVELIEDISSPYKTNCTECINKMYKSLDDLLSRTIDNDRYTKKSSLKLFHCFDGSHWKPCVDAIGIERTKKLILERLTFHKLTASCKDTSHYSEINKRDMPTGWLIEFTY